MSRKSTSSNRISRRTLLKRAATAAGAVAFPNILTGCATTGGTKAVAANDKVTMGVIGFGWQGGNNTQAFLSLGDVQVVAMCDIDEEHLAQGKKMVDDVQGNTDCATYHKFEELLARDDIDTVLLSLPDHWHAIPAIASANAGKHVWGEKPLSHKLAEGRAMVNAVEKNKVIWQTGSWQRSEANFHRCAELVRNGAIGKVHTIECGLTSGQSDYMKNGDQTAFREPPAILDYPRWLGPSGTAAELPYAPARCHKNWRWVMAHGGGAMMDWVGHHLDIAHWGMGYDETGPVEVKGTGVFPAPGTLWDSPTAYDCYATYADGVVLHASSDFPGGTKWIGDKGWIFVSRGDKQESNIDGIFETDRETLPVKLYKSDNHWQNFIDCVRSGEPTITPCETAHRSASVGHLFNIAMYTGRTIRWDPKNETIAGDAEASAMLEPVYYQGWTL